MAKSRHNRLEYAIKFYLSQAAFEAEVELYGTRGGAPASPLAQFLPLVRSHLYSVIGMSLNLFHLSAEN